MRLTKNKTDDLIGKWTKKLVYEELPDGVLEELEKRVPKSNGNKSAKFKFKGISSHAAGAPQNGRSALDGVEAMNMMVNITYL